MITEKYCSSCKLIKPVSEFYRRRDRPNGYVSKCKPCRNTYHSTYIKTEAGKRSAKETSRKAWERYGRAYMQTPKGKAVAKRRNAKYRETECGLGLFKDDIRILQAAIDYLIKHKS